MVIIISLIYYELNVTKTIIPLNVNYMCIAIMVIYNGIRIIIYILYKEKNRKTKKIEDKFYSLFNSFIWCLKKFSDL